MTNKNKSKTFFIIAGEESADNHGSALINAIHALNPEICFIGIGGEKMIKAGLQSIEDIKKLSIMGFVEILKHLSFFNNLTKRILEEIIKTNPDQIILIDYPGFNLRLTKKIKKHHNIPITYYISPQLWAWKENRIEIIRKYVDQMLVIFPFEKNWYEKRNISVEFVGHPIFDEWTPTNKIDLCKLLKININKPIITLYPGSRSQELNHHLTLFIEVAKKIREKNGDIQFILGLAKNLNLKQFVIPDWISIENENPQKALECADLALVASGSATIEAAVFGTPMIIVYKMHLLSWWISKLFIKVNYAGMVNIIANRKIMPEYLQNNAAAQTIANKANNIINSKKQLKEMQLELLHIKEKLKTKGASQKAANHILLLSNIL